MMRLFPNAQLVEIPGAGHWVHADKPAEFIGEVLKFLE
jgi:pimeloyl-ACP methyl ester carboxylesterase